MARFDDRYRQFGPQVTEIVRAHLKADGSIGALLRRLNLPDPADIDHQHASLRQFLFRYGVTFFQALANSDLSPAEIERLKARRMMESTGVRRSEQRTPTEGPTATRARDATAPRPPPPPPVPQEPDPVPPQGRKWVETDTYSGPDRRCVEDRRHGTGDRRARVDIIYKNHRFGGRDRRKAVRRAADREKSRNS